jgi:hypothetical protein
VKPIRYQFYDRSTGLFHGKVVITGQASGAEKFAERNSPPGHAYIQGEFDPLSQRVDVGSGKVVDYQPLQPSPDHEWSATNKRWALNTTTATKAQERVATLAQIAALETGQHRVVRECALGNTLGVKRLLEIEAQIKALRAKL